MAPRRQWLAALDLAASAHEGQYRLNGAPYITHPMRMAESAANAGESGALSVVIILHDVLEDQPRALLEGGVLYFDKFRVELSQQQEDALVALTHREEHTYQEYIDAIEACGGFAVLAKLYDLTDNLEDLTPERESLRKRYIKAATQLS